MERHNKLYYGDTENICNMDGKMRIELNQSKKTGKYYATFIVHAPERRIHQGWRETKEIFPDEFEHLIDYFLEKEATGRGNAHNRI